jgi:GT2 family glycosyltransferase
MGRIDALHRCLRSLTSVPGDDLEILVVDNRPAAGTYELVCSWRARDRRIRYLAERRRGSSNARNRGVAETGAEFVVFTDDDVVLEPTWLAWLLAPFADANVTAVTGMVLPLELETVAQKQFEQYGGFCKGFERRAYDLDANRAANRLLYPYWGGLFGAGNSMAFRRDWLVASGGFDPALGGGTPAQAGEDIEAMSRAILGGGRLVYEPRSQCWHEHRRDDGGLRAQLFGYGVGLTATLTKALMHDSRFPAAAVRSLPIAFATHRRHARRSVPAAGLAPELARIERLGMMRGPVMYARSVRAAHRMRLGAVISGG